MVCLPLVASQEDTNLRINSQRLRELLTELAELGKSPEGGISRLGFSEADRVSREWLIEKMQDTEIAYVEFQGFDKNSD